MDEPCFPRGGTKPRKQNAEEKPKTKNLFGVPQSTSIEKKKRQRKEKEPADNLETTLRLSSVDGLTYNKVQPGMVVLAVVKEISNLNVKVQLPGTIYADVQINAISDKFTNTLLNSKNKIYSLNDILKIGDYVPIQILDISEKDNGSKQMTATMNPKNINSLLGSDSFKKDMLIWGCVGEKSDYVYSIDLGVHNTRCILNIKDIDDEKEFVEGQPLWLVVNKINTTDNITTLNVSNRKARIINHKSPVLNLDVVTPGSCIEVFVQKELKEGLEVTFFNRCTGYINKVYCKSISDDLEDYVGKKVKAQLLYKNVLTKFFYFSTRGFEEETPSYANGTIVKSKVSGSFYKGIITKLENGALGFVTYKRLIKSIKVKADSDVTNVIHQTYAKGSSYKCRIMDYSYIDKMYVCTFETDVIKEKHFNKEDLKLGEIVNGEIENVTGKGLVVRVGKLQCFVTNEHLSNARYSDKIKQKFKAGQKIKAKVWSVTEKSIRLTLKQALLEETDCLTSFDNIKPNQKYLGLVINVRPRMILVKFYGDIKGALYNTEKHPEFENFFYQGQVVGVNVVSKNRAGLILSIHDESKSLNENVVVGKAVKGVVKHISDDGMSVIGSNFEGFLPKNHLSCDNFLSKSMMKYYKVGDNVKNLVCTSNSTKGIILSRREYDCLVTQKMSIPRNNKMLKVGSVLRGSVTSSDGENLKLEVITKKSPVEVTIDEPDPNVNYYHDQSLIVKITKIENNKYYGSLQSTKIDCAYGSNFLYNYLRDVETVKGLAKNQGDPLASYNVGQLVECKILKIADDACIVETDDGIKGVAAPAHFPNNQKVGANVKGIVIFVNLVHGVLEMSFKPQIVGQKFGNVDELKIDDELFAKILEVHNNFAIASLKHGKKKYLGYVPIAMNENDNETNLEYYRGLHKFRFVVSLVRGNFLIGYPKDYVRHHQPNRKRKVENVTSETETAKKIKLESTNGMDVDNNVDSGVENEIKSEDLEIKTEDEVKNIPNPVRSIERAATKKFEIPSMKSFFDDSKRSADGASSEEEEEESSAEDENENKQRKKLTKEERVEQIRKQEEEIRRKELEYANMKDDTIPENAEQFERCLFAKPNSSALWIQYAAFHISETEVDKARAVFKRALETVDPTCVQEKLNIWTSYMNLENIYGNKQSFDEVFREAVRCNDDLQVYLNAMNILAKSQNPHDVDDIITKMKMKFKQEPKMYIEAAKVYYDQRRFSDARKLRTKALTTVVNVKDHIPLIVQFAKMEFEKDEDEYAETLFETILRDMPQRVDVWCVYVDQLVKKGKIDIARRVLQRGVTQKLKISKMRSLCKKYVSFENQHGDDETKKVAEETLKEVFSSDK